MTTPRPPPSAGRCSSNWRAPRTGMAIWARGVLVGPVSLTLGLELDLAVVCGMAEGTFPARRNDDALLPGSRAARRRPGPARPG